MFGLFLVIVGVLLLFEEMGWIQGDFWGYFWPVIIILFGLSLIKKRNSYNCWCSWCFPHRKEEKEHHHGNCHHKVIDEQ